MQKSMGLNLFGIMILKIKKKRIKIQKFVFFMTNLI